jgi:uncharacterized protein (DUF433 family)
MAGDRQPKQQSRIIQDPTILAGTPVVNGTRIPVELVLAKLAVNLDLADLFADYPRLTVADVKACLAYAKDVVGEQRLSEPATGIPHYTLEQAYGSGSVPTPPHLKGKDIDEMIREAKEERAERLMRKLKP